MPIIKNDYERGVIDGMQKQAQSSVDKAVNAMAQRTWVGLTQNEVKSCWLGYKARGYPPERVMVFYKLAEQMLKEKNT